MLKSVKIENFQSHQNTELEFHAGMNVIVGSTDSGKTAIIRALRWVIQNRPGGDSFRSDWGGDTSVIIEVDDTKITRLKTNKDNQYILGENTIFKAFGQGVPDEIQKAINFDDYNIQQQLDTPFLLSESSGDIAAHFNKVANLDKIDTGLQNIQKKINSINSDIRSNEKQIQEKQEQVNNFIDLNSFEKELITLEKIIDSKNITLEKKKELNGISNQLYTIQQEIHVQSKILKIEKHIDTILKLYESKKEISGKYTKLKNLSISIYYAQKRIKEREKQVLAELLINETIKLHEKRTQTAKLVTNLSKLYLSIEACKKSQQTALKQVSALEVEYKKNFPDICPLCETKIK